MKRRWILITTALGISLMSGCHKESCNEDSIIRLVNDEIRSSKKDPSDYNVAKLEKRSNSIYVGMSLKHSPLYHRHYLINPQKCRISDIRIDQ